MDEVNPTITFARGRYVVQERLGAGGLAEVFLAIDTRTQERVAIKTLLPQHTREPMLRKRFLSDALLCTHVAHPNVLTVIDSGEEGEKPFVVMPFAQGGDLANVLKRSQRCFSSEQARDLGKALASALAAAHQKGLIHGDVKPSNILLMFERGRSEDPMFMLSDFGHARTLSTASMTGSSLAWGSPAYMAPEVLVHGRGDPRSDLFSLGVLLYEALTLRRPWSDTGALSRLVGKPALPSLDLDDFDLVQLILRLLSADPNERPASALTVLDSLQRGVPLPDLRRQTKCSNCGVARPFDVFVCLKCGFEEFIASDENVGPWQLLLLRLPETVSAWEGFHSLLSQITGIPEVTFNVQMHDGDRGLGDRPQTSLPAILFGGLSQSAAQKLQARFASAGLNVVAVKGMFSRLRYSLKAKASYVWGSLATGGILFTFIPQVIGDHRTLALSGLAAACLFMGLYQHSKKKAPLFLSRHHQVISVEGQHILGLLRHATQSPLCKPVQDLVHQVSAGLFRITAAWSTNVPQAAWDALEKAVAAFVETAQELGRIDAVLGQGADIELIRAASTLQRRIEAEPTGAHALVPNLREVERALEQRAQLMRKSDALVARLCDFAGHLDFLSQGSQVEPEQLERWLAHQSQRLLKP